MEGTATEQHAASAISGRNIRILPMAATAEEVEAMLTIEKRAFQKSVFKEFVFGGSSAGMAGSVSMNTRVQKQLDNMATGNFIYHKAVDPANGETIGTASWYLAADPQAQTEYSPFGPAPDAPSQDCLDAVIGRIRRWRLQYFRELDVPYAQTMMLSVAPEAQRRGVGTALLAAGLEEVDRRGWHTYISATPEGRRLYMKLGWEDKFRTVVDLKDYGGPDEVVITTAMIRPPHPKGEHDRRPTGSDAGQKHSDL